MNIKICSVLLVVLYFFTSCGSSKKVTSPATNKVTVVDTASRSSEVPTVKQVVPKSTTTKSHTVAYIEKFAPIAIKKMQEYNIPASITLAQGVLESGSGRSPLAIRSNNHFGIKCHKGWEGHSVTHDDDEKGECFRKYKYPETSYEDHSKFLISRKRYASLFQLKNTDYKGWAYGLKKAGYATDKKYPQKLISIINTYNLTQYDKMKTAEKVSFVPRKSIGNYYKVQKGDTLYSISKKFNISVEKLKEVNGLKGNTIQIGQHLLL